MRLEKGECSLQQAWISQVQKQLSAGSSLTLPDRQSCSKQCRLPCAAARLWRVSNLSTTVLIALPRTLMFLIDTTPPLWASGLS